MALQLSKFNHTRVMAYTLLCGCGPKCPHVCFNLIDTLVTLVPSFKYISLYIVLILYVVWKTVDYGQKRSIILKYFSIKLHVQCMYSTLLGILRLHSWHRNLAIGQKAEYGDHKCRVWQFKQRQ